MLMSMMVSFIFAVLFSKRFVLSFFPRDVLDEILNLIESVSEGFPTYFRTCTVVSIISRYFCVDILR